MAELSCATLGNKPNQKMTPLNLHTAQFLTYKRALLMLCRYELQCEDLYIFPMYNGTEHSWGPEIFHFPSLKNYEPPLYTPMHSQTVHLLEVLGTKTVIMISCFIQNPTHTQLNKFIYETRTVLGFDIKATKSCLTWS